MAQKLLHTRTLEKVSDLCVWFDEKLKSVPIPIYSSYDIRDSGYKVTNVDANIFPAGFNNICHVDKENAVEIMDSYIHSHYGSDITKIVLVIEEHTNNLHYLDNILAIKQIIEKSNREVRLAVPRILPASLHLTSATGHPVSIFSAIKGSLIQEFQPNLIISNNDFSDPYEDWAKTMTIPINPPRELGWYQRSKNRYFHFYNQLVEEFSEISGADPFLMGVRTTLIKNFEIEDSTSRENLALAVNQMIEELKIEYEKRKIKQEPFVFVKNDSGTYGLAVIKVTSGDEIKNWNYKSRKKMKAAKGGRDVQDVVIQEGVPSIVQHEGISAEPVIYMIGHCLAGGFLRTHQDKSSTESLNSPGAIYRKLCVSDLAIRPEGCPMENVYGWTAKLGLLAIAYEAQEMGVHFKNYKI